MFDWTTAADGMFPLKSLNIIATNANCQINPCNRCEGNCANDDDCTGNLKCWERSYSHSTVPGCATGGEANKNYCYEPCPEGALPVNGCKNTFFSFDFTPTKALISGKTCNNGNCDECEGNCDDDSDCAGNLKCWKREHSHSNVPGCATGGAGNYCYKPCPNDGHKAVPYVHGCRSNLRTVLRETAGCSVTDGTIDVWVNGATGANEVYDIISSSDMRLGGQLIMGTNNIVDVGSLQAADITTGTLYVTDLSGTGVVDGNNIKNGAVTEAKIGTNAVTSATIKNGAVTEAKIGTNAVSSAKIKNGAVTTAKIATNAVTPATLQNSGHFTMGRVKADYISAGNPSWNSGWRVNLDQNVWIHRKLEVDGKSDLQGGLKVWGKSELTGGLKVTGTWGQTAAAGYKSIWSYHDGDTWGGKKIYHGSRYDYVYIYGHKEKKWVTAEFRGYIAVEYGMFGQSDRRIKTNIVDLSDISSLQKVLQIPARNYQYKDKLKRGFGNVTGFIAQEVNETFPEACREGTEFIPYIDEVYSVISFKDNKVIIPTIQGDEKLVTGDVIEVMLHIDDESGPMRQFSVTNVTTDTVVLECIECKEGDDKADRILIRSKQIHDFLHIDKQRIFTLHHGAIQELHREQEVLIARVASLEETIAKLSERLAALDGQS